MHDLFYHFRKQWFLLWSKKKLEGKHLGKNKLHWIARVWVGKKWNTLMHTGHPQVIFQCWHKRSYPPQQRIFDCLVTKKSADARSPKSLYLSHNKYVKPTNIFKAQFTGKIIGTKVGKKQWSSSTYLMIHNKTTVGGFWLVAFVMGQI